MRKINTEDVFKMARLIKKGNVGQVIKDAYAAGGQEGADAKQIGMDAFIGIVCACSASEVEEDLYELLSGICEKSPEDVRRQSLETTIEDIKKICEENNVVNFWKSASGLSGKIQG